jgi:hypothetical protein
MSCTRQPLAASGHRLCCSSAIGRRLFRTVLATHYSYLNQSARNRCDILLGVSPVCDGSLVGRIRTGLAPKTPEEERIDISPWRLLALPFFPPLRTDVQLQDVTKIDGRADAGVADPCGRPNDRALRQFHNIGWLDTPYRSDIKSRGRTAHQKRGGQISQKQREDHEYAQDRPHE